ncbi:YkvA family protein [Verrucomicrobiota bacterium sgz303538]
MKSKTEKSPPPLSRTEFNDYIVFHAHKLSPKDLHTVAAQVPTLREGFSEVKAAAFPRTPERLAFLADIVEAFSAGKCDDMPFESAAEAAFALVYLDQEIDLLPDSLPEIGYTDDATIVALVIERNSPAFRKFAEANGKDWESIASVERAPELP